MKKIEIECNRKVRDFVCSQVKLLTGLNVGQAYELLKKDGCLPVAEFADVLKRGKKLKKLIDGFKFPASVPMRPVDERHLWQFRERWSKHLQAQLDKMVSSSKPIYFVDEVNKQLRRRKSSIQCSRIHIIWFLDMYGEENMTPEAIATAIIKFGLKDWSKVQPLKNNAKYIVTIFDDDLEVDKEEFKHLVEFISDIPKSNTQNNLINKIQNDIKVLNDFCKLWESAPTTYDYIKVFEEYVSRLQTLPPSKKKVSLKKESSPSLRPDDDETLLKEWNYDQLINFMKELSQKVKFGKEDFANVKNQDKMREFAERDDFDEIFGRLKDHENVYQTFGNAMQYIRNVVNHNQTTWSMQPYPTSDQCRECEHDI